MLENNQEPQTPFPYELYFHSIGYPMGGSTTYLLNRDGLLTLTEQGMGQLEPYEITHRLRVIPQGWRKFLQRIAPLHIESWKPDYQPDSPILDGYAWEFRFASGGIKIHSAGENAGPDPDNPEQALSGFIQECADTLLSNALDALWKRSKPAP